MDDAIELPADALATPASPPQKKKRAAASGRLTALRVKTIKEPGRYGDGGGLYLVVKPSGSRAWVLRLMIRGKRCDMGLGSASLVPLAEARDEAIGLRRIAHKGGDPRVERKRKRTTMPTFKDAATKAHAHHAERFRNDKHAEQWLASLDNHVFPQLGDRNVDVITAADVHAVLAPIWNKKIETARRVMQRIKVVFDWAIGNGFRPEELGNPVDGARRGLSKQKAQKTHQPAMPYVQVPAFVETLRAAEANETTKLAFEFLVLTAARTSEVIGARWTEIDRETNTWTIPASRIKAGREHRVPLSPRCVEILERAEALADGGPYVFPGRYPQQPLSSMAFLMLLRRLRPTADGEGAPDKRPTDVVVHGFRSSFRDWAAERTHAATAVCEAALAHAVKNQTEAAYFRSDLFEQRQSLMDTWAKFVTTAPAKVVSIRA
jgi:integrase